MNSSPELHLLLEQIGKQLNAVEKKLESASALNGGFDTLNEKVDRMQKDFEAVKITLLGDGNQVGVVTRLRELENANVERQKFLATVVEPGLKEHQRLVFEMEGVRDLIKNEETQKQEIVLLKERVGILNKVMWLFGTGLGGVVLKSLFDMMAG
tara:strand:+ start:653 stop:1114 length:462 start_codon:yes stop_codon:yes gene_type:complete